MIGINTRAVASLAAVVTLGLGLAACGSSSDDADSTSSASTSTSASADASESSSSDDTTASGSLEDIVAQAQKSVDGMKDSFGGIYSDIKIEAEGDDTLKYTYVFADASTADAAKSSLKDQYDTFQSTCDSTITPMLEQAGVKDAKVEYIFQGPDGDEVGSYTCS
ncbi:MAG: DUF4854 domain-containing protein [Nocardioides sp.]|uniref:DUF4854 domain-containing protein n=1 Tax=Nocardioides sp. TaxID=35761 RepID=UPI0039E3BA0A